MGIHLIVISDEYCNCLPNMKAALCFTDLRDQCSSKPCHKGGSYSCTDLQGDFYCNCKKGWTGKTCSTGNFSHFVLRQLLHSSYITIFWFKNEQFHIKRSSCTWRLMWIFPVAEVLLLGNALDTHVQENVDVKKHQCFTECSELEKARKLMPSIKECLAVVLKLFYCVHI